ncbi:ABC transporter ATP-binding protein [Advenella mimigardefordensis]|uniref:Aliphatic sulfonates import ATP-binding protein SsuB n=1 Tax=Advenella mimigardefordensis (strain DSM 17166 / LMG 22922 / DPN7) TaxID=1247726 RepID=W0PAP6_ADVMD|nr:ABC transporter ATP-binding protein [Advenella mimigardefordensis]AHG62128.1 aliphatic sulfonates import ATP-binding protein SsuB [Advenella mimigardefordensis DPN7]
MNNATVKVENLSRRFGTRAVLDRLTFEIQPGEFVALIGKSGSGKSTLLRALARLDSDVAGDGHIEVPASLSVLFQDSRLLPWHNVLSNVTLGLHDADALNRARQALTSVGLGGREDAWPNSLSGGEQQRAALARSLVRRPRLLLADEPFGALDALTRLRMQSLLLNLVQIHRPAVVLVTHDVEEALLLADRVLLMDDGHITLDRQIAITHPRRKNRQAFDDLRDELLAALGVTELA